MAKSMNASVRKAQHPLSCPLCDGHGTTIKWRCEECGIYMCTHCKETKHSRLKSAGEHEVVSIEDIGSESAPREVSSVVVSSVFNSYDTPVRNIHSLLSSDDDIVYLLSSNPPGHTKFVKAKLLKASMKILQSQIQVGDSKWFDFALEKDGSVLFDSPGTLYLQVILPSGEINKVLNAEPVRPLALHVNKSGELLVGVRDQGEPFKIGDFSCRQVIIFDSSYNRKKTLEFDNTGKRLFGYPLRICTDSKDVIYIIDLKDYDYNAVITAVDRNSRLRFTYKGHSRFDNFKPNGMAVTPSDNIVVSDFINDALHVLNSKGNLLALQVVAEINITDPYGLCFDSEDFLLIGCAGNSDNSAKLHVVKLSESLM